MLVFLKPCDTYSFNQLLTEHRFDREKVYAVGHSLRAECWTSAKLKAAADGIAAVHADGDTVVVDTLYDGDVTLDRADAAAGAVPYTASRKSTSRTTSCSARTAKCWTATGSTR